MKNTTFTEVRSIPSVRFIADHGNIWCLEDGAPPVLLATAYIPRAAALLTRLLNQHAEAKRPALGQCA